MEHKNEYVWALIGRFLPLFVQLVTMMILARYLTPEDFGMVGVLTIFFVVANTLMDTGLGGSLVKEPVINKIDCSTIFVFNITVSHLLYLILFVFSNTIETFFETRGLSNVIITLCLVFVINAWGLVPRALLMRNLLFRTITIINVVSVIGASLLSIIAASLKFGVYSLVVYQVTISVITALMSIHISGFSVSFRFSIKSFRRLIPFGIFTTLTTIIDTVYENMITFLFGKYLNMYQAGLLSQAKKIEEIPSQSVASTISSVAFPVLTKIRNESMLFAKECNMTFKNVMMLTLPLLFSLSIFSETIVTLAFGNKWAPAAPYLSLLVFAAVFHIAETLIRAFIKSTTKVEQLFNYTILKRLLGIIVIILFLLLDPKLTLVGYIISTFIGFVFNIILLGHVSEITFWGQVKLFLSTLVPSAIYYLLMCLVCSFLEVLFWQLLIAAISLLFYYFVILKLYGINIYGWMSQIIRNMRHKA